MELISIYIAIIYLFALLKFTKYRDRGQLSIASFIIGLYLFSIIGSLFLDESLSVPEARYSFYASFIFLVLLTMYFIPIISFNSANIKNTIIYNKKLFIILSYLFIFLGLSSYVYFIPVIYELVLSPESILILRTDLVGGTVYVSINYVYYVLTLFGQFYPIVIIFYFQSLSSNPEKVFLNRLLLFSSTSYIVNVLSSMGRDGFVLWGLSFVFGYILYRNQLSIKIKKELKQRMIILFAIFFSIFFIITIARFYRDDNIYFLIQYILSYYVQQFGEFNQFLTIVKNTDIDINISKLFPILKTFMDNKDEGAFLDGHFYFLHKYGFSKYVFKTFLGSIYENIGLILSFFLSFFASLVGFIFAYRGSYKRKNTSVKFGKMIFITLFSQVLLHGIFYYKLEHTVSNIYVILTILLAIVFSYNIQSNKKEV